jgi:hypothetical protein
MLSSWPRQAVWPEDLDWGVARSFSRAFGRQTCASPTNHNLARPLQPAARVDHDPCSRDARLRTRLRRVYERTPPSADSSPTCSGSGSSVADHFILMEVSIRLYGLPEEFSLTARRWAAHVRDVHLEQGAVTGPPNRRTRASVSIERR